MLCVLFCVGQVGPAGGIGQSGGLGLGGGGLGAGRLGGGVRGGIGGGLGLGGGLQQTKGLTLGNGTVHPTSRLISHDHSVCHVCTLVIVDCVSCCVSAGGVGTQTGMGGMTGLASSQPILSTAAGATGGGALGMSGQPFQLQRPPLGKKRGSGTT